MKIHKKSFDSVDNSRRTFALCALSCSLGLMFTEYSTGGMRINVKCKWRVKKNDVLAWKGEWMNGWMDERRQICAISSLSKHCISSKAKGRRDSGGGKKTEKKTVVKCWLVQCGSQKFVSLFFLFEIVFLDHFLPLNSNNNSPERVWMGNRCELEEMKCLSIRNLTTWTTWNCQSLFRINDKWISLISASAAAVKTTTTTKMMTNFSKRE